MSGPGENRPAGTVVIPGIDSHHHVQKEQHRDRYVRSQPPGISRVVNEEDLERHNRSSVNCWNDHCAHAARGEGGGEPRGVVNRHSSNDNSQCLLCQRTSGPLARPPTHAATTAPETLHTMDLLKTSQYTASGCRGVITPPGTHSVTQARNRFRVVECRGVRRCRWM